MIKNMINELLKFDENKWEKYIYAREPLKNKLSQKQKSEYKSGAENCGHDIANEIILKYGLLTPREYAQKLEVKVIDAIDQESTERVMFMKFERQIGRAHV